jgi:hypothetical protein
MFVYYIYTILTPFLCHNFNLILIIMYIYEMTLICTLICTHILPLTSIFDNSISILYLSSTLVDLWGWLQLTAKTYSSIKTNVKLVGNKLLCWQFSFHRHKLTHLKPNEFEKSIYAHELYICVRLARQVTWDEKFIQIFCSEMLLGRYNLVDLHVDG